MLGTGAWPNDLAGKGEEVKGGRHLYVGPIASGLPGECFLDAL
jgi:hypothetical protein